MWRTRERAAAKKAMCRMKRTDRSSKSNKSNISMKLKKTKRERKKLRKSIVRFWRHLETKDLPHGEEWFDSMCQLFESLESNMRSKSNKSTLEKKKREKNSLICFYVTFTNMTR